jgi:DNA polymerase III epsilon subunit family exonuclease
MQLKDAKLVFVDVETTGLSPAMGDRIIELGLITCKPRQEPRHASQLINPDRPIPADARRVHGIMDADVANVPRFEAVAKTVGKLFQGAWLVGHNIRFDVGFLAMEFALSGCRVEPAGCLDTCQLAAAAWELPDYRLDTITSKLGIARTTKHRALDDALATQKVFNMAVEVLCKTPNRTIADLQSAHRYRPTWPINPQTLLPGLLYDALTSGQPISIRYENGKGQTSRRVIRPLTCFNLGSRVYIKAFCTKTAEIRTFRLDHIIDVSDPSKVRHAPRVAQMETATRALRMPQQHLYCHVCGRATQGVSRGDCTECTDLFELQKRRKLYNPLTGKVWLKSTGDGTLSDVTPSDHRVADWSPARCSRQLPRMPWLSILVFVGAFLSECLRFIFRSK